MAINSRLSEPVKSNGSANGKLLLFGEHSAVYGQPALGLSLPSTSSIDLDLSPGPGTIDWQGVPDEYQKPFGKLLYYILMQCLDPGYQSKTQDADFNSLNDIYHGRVRYRSTIPQAGGYGSSAALCAAATRAFAAATALPATHIARIANNGENIFHGKASGIDVALSLSTGLSAVYPDISGESRFPSTQAVSGYGFYLVSASLPRERSTRELIGGIQKQARETPQQTKVLLLELGNLAREAITLCSIPAAVCIKELGALAITAQSILKKLGVSNPALETVLKAGIEAGASGGKLSGAGGGGAFYLIAEDLESAAAIHRRVLSFFQDSGYPENRVLPIINLGETDIHEEIE